MYTLQNWCSGVKRVSVHVSAVRDTSVAGRVRRSNNHHQRVLRHHRDGRLSQGGATAAANRSLVGIQRFTTSIRNVVVLGTSIYATLRSVAFGY